MKIVIQNILWLLLFVAYNYMCLANDSYTVGVILNEENAQSIIPIRNNIDTKNLMQKEVQFKPSFQQFNKSDSYIESKTFCEMLNGAEGISSIFEPKSSSISSVLKSIASHYEIPYFQSSWEPSSDSSSSTNLNFFPETDLFAQGLATIVKSLHWRSFIIIYENEDALIRMQEILKLQNIEEGGKQNLITLKQLDPSNDFRSMLKEIKNSTESCIILDCNVEKIMPFMEQAKQINLLNLHFSYFLTSLDAHTLDWKSLNVLANITTVRLFNPQDQAVIDKVANWELTEYRLYKNPSQQDPALTPNTIKTETALMHDAVDLFTEAVRILHVTQSIQPYPINCQFDTIWKDGLPIVAFMKVTQPKVSLTGPLKFNEQGKRIEFQLYLVEINGNKVIATWYSNDTIIVVRNTSDSSMAQVESLQKVTVRVASRIGPPYLMLRKPKYEGDILTGNAKFEGYSFDLIAEIATFLNFTFEFYIPEDSNYGKPNPVTGEWNGLIRELLDRRAHLAICDLTITHQRQQAVDFSMPFMTLGISILYQKGIAEKVNMFAFLDPFSFEVWIYTATLYLAVSIILYFVSRMAPGDWENPHPCDENPEELENIWDIKNCTWLTLGSIMTQGCDILPKGISSRMTTSMWWFFSLIMTSSYTANLAAFLTMQRMEEPIDSAEALAKQTKIKYGTVEGGATQSFFRGSNYSTYKKMWSSMKQSRPSVFEAENARGVERVRNTRDGLYAFLMESSQIEYEIETKCDLKQVGDWLDSKGFGIAMPPNSPYLSAINTAVLTLQERGKLLELKTKWWKKKRSEPSCDNDEETETNSSELALDNVGGVFLVLGIGVGIAFSLAIVEFLWNVRNVAVNEHMSYKDALKVELLFAMNIWITKKRTKPKIPSSNSSTDGNEDAKSIAKSILHGAGSFINLNVINKLGSTLQLNEINKN